ncbi:MAG: methionyl-tRNA formyltransferase [Clostridia bacterium]|nr:methionyl-tRNA formyltransferase [Clostridia bacterium]
MKVLFMGTPDFAVPSLEALIRAGHDVCAVFSQPDRPSGRGMKLLPPAVKVAAMEHNIPVYQPTKLKNDALLPLLDEYKPDVIAVVAYGRILPKYILDYPKYGCINVHGSLLPKYRGAAPIQWAVLNGDEKSGVCTMYMDEGLDTGDIIERVETPIGEDETAESLFDRLSIIGAETLVSTLKLLEEGTAIRTKQDEMDATYARMLTREDGKIDWTKSSREVCNIIRGSYSWPIAYTVLNDVKIKIYHAQKGNKTKECAGKVVSIDARGMEVSCGNGETILVTELQFPNSKRMAPDDYFRGHESILGEILL